MLVDDRVERVELEVVVAAAVVVVPMLGVLDGSSELLVVVEPEWVAITIESMSMKTRPPSVE